MNKVLFIPDVHIPYHDKRAWALMLKCARKFKPDTVVVLGDFADFYSVSAHSKDPNRAGLLDQEIAGVSEALSQLNALGASKKVFIAGNHENRLERYLMDKAPELFNVVRVKSLLRLSENGWDYVPYKSDYRLGKLYLTHDVGCAGAGAIRAALSTYQGNVVTGHTHRFGLIVEGNARGKTHISASFGWLGDAKQADYMHRVKAARDWALGFGFGYMTPQGNIHIVPVPIVGYTCIVEGKMVRG